MDKMGMGREYRVLGVVADGRGEDGGSGEVKGGGKMGAEGVQGEKGEAKEGGEEEGAVWPFVGGEDV